jgi:hypothetical protein
MHGLTGGGWKRKRRPRSSRVGQPGGKPRERRPWDLPAITPPRQPPTLHGRFYRSRLLQFLRRLNQHLMRWACRKYRRLKRRERRAMAWLAQIARRSPRMFAHWRLGARPDGWAMGAG